MGTPLRMSPVPTTPVSLPDSSSSNTPLDASASKAPSKPTAPKVEEKSTKDKKSKKDKKRKASDEEVRSSTYYSFNTNIPLARLRRTTKIARNRARRKQRPSVNSSYPKQLKYQTRRSWSRSIKSLRRTSVRRRLRAMKFAQRSRRNQSLRRRGK